MRLIIELDRLYPGQTLWAVGRGPSLANLQAKHFGEGPVIAINQAIEVVETLNLPNPVYSMQKDVYFFPPKYAPILAHSWESYKKSKPELDRLGAYVFDNEKDFGAIWWMPSVVSCAGLAIWMGCKNVVYLCCDASTDGITDTYGTPPTDPNGYLGHKPAVTDYIRHYHIPVEWRRI